MTEQLKFCITAKNGEEALSDSGSLCLSVKASEDAALTEALAKSEAPSFCFLSIGLHVCISAWKVTCKEEHSKASRIYELSVQSCSDNCVIPPGGHHLGCGACWSAAASSTATRRSSTYSHRIVLTIFAFKP